MSTREVTSASAATFSSAFVEASPDEPWHVVDKQTDLPCVVSQPDTVVRISPMNRQYGGWNDAHFHPQLRLPPECPTGQGLVVTLEARARECVAVALSPEDTFDLGTTYVVHFGAAGNNSTVIRRRLPNGTEAVDVTFMSRVCQERSWTSYWIALLGDCGKLYVGTGKVVGKNCMGCLDDSLYHQLRSPSDAVKYVGLGNSALGRNARPLKMRNVCVTSVPSYLVTLLKSLPTDLPYVSVEEQEQQDSEETKALMEEYQNECHKNKARALKFGIPYKEPAPQAFLQWSQARRLRANPEKGFITGMDIMSPEELAKQEARKARFGVVTKQEDDDKKRKGVDEEEGHDNDDTTMMEEDAEPLPILQAWDNEKLVKEHRVDPPSSLYVNPSLSEETQEMDEFAMTPAAPATFVPEKIHLCSIDWAAFKQIRTDDIMAYFKDYGPSYVEWLGELSCNVLFEDKFSAARALHKMSQELPSPPPPEALFLVAPDEGDEEMNAPTPPDFGNMGWRFCNQPIRKITNDRYGRRGTTARVLMRMATSEDILVERPKSRPAPPPGFSTKRVLGPGSDFDTEPREKKRRRTVESQSEGAPPIDMFDPNSTAEHPALSRGLKAGRGGFSVEELEAERAQKAQADTAPEAKSEF